MISLGHFVFYAPHLDHKKSEPLPDEKRPNTEKAGLSYHTGGLRKQVADEQLSRWNRPAAQTSARPTSRASQAQKSARRLSVLLASRYPQKETRVRGLQGHHGDRRIEMLRA